MAALRLVRLEDSTMFEEIFGELPASERRAA
jgi:hypothetical protein